MTTFSYGIRSEWSNDPTSLQDICVSAIETFEALRAADPVFRELSTVDEAEDYIPLKAARSRIAKLVEGNVSRDDYGEAEPESGYSVFATTQKSLAVPLRRSMNLILHAGGAWRNHLSLQAGGILVDPDPDFVTYHAFRAGLITLGRLWPLPFAHAYAYSTSYGESSLARGEPPVPYSQFHMGWISYLSAPLAAGLVPPRELVSERTPGGGWLLSAVQERLDPTNPDHLRRARLLSQLMLERLGTGDVSEYPAAREGPY